ncbi:gliding motility protein GldB-related protein [Luteimonas notoginsengisoli]|uniref:DUF885 domain-containing protein n=1 Tax=Luteimonas notoginsengisoli TaxID=1578200 RepID=A0ABV7UV92_9GAMM
MNHAVRSMGIGAVLCVWSASLAAMAADAVYVPVRAATAGSVIQTTDVDRFYRVYDAAGGHPTAEQIQRDYLDQGSEGLQVLARERNVTGQRIAYSRNAAEAVGRELEIETRFAADIDKTDLSDWVYNATPDTPGDLGYWVGYRIAKAYYRNAPDKRQALRDIMDMEDPKAFLEKSGWYPGIELD